jgi:hypothetical protein
MLHTSGDVMGISLNNVDVTEAKLGTKVANVKYVN